jgi:hypothetical protein
LGEWSYGVYGDVMVDMFPVIDTSTIHVPQYQARPGTRPVPVLVYTWYRVGTTGMGKQVLSKFQYTYYVLLSTVVHVCKS